MSETPRSMTSDMPPAALIASVGLALLGSLARDAGDLDEAHSAFSESILIWPNNSTALYRLADLELHHGGFERAASIYRECAALPPFDAAPRSPAWHAELIATPRIEAVSIASYMLSLLLHLVGKCDEATPYLQRLGVTHKLSPAVWAALRSTPHKVLPMPKQPSAKEVSRYADAVPPRLLKQLQTAFDQSSPFWTESEYATRGYFSFWQPMRGSASGESTPAPCHAIEALAVHLLPLTGLPSTSVVGFEWWVHSKQASRSLGNAHGHQLHFDTEEGLLYRDGSPIIAHPAVSSVLYLNGTVPGPTLVLDQRYGDEVPARSARVSHPAEGHLLLFPGDLLHGICPAPPPTATISPSTTNNNSNKRKRPEPLPQQLCATSKMPRRVTLMIGFYTHAEVVDAVRRRPLYSACSPMPRATRQCTWPSLLELEDGGEEEEHSPIRHEVREVRPAWEAVPTSGRVEVDAWAGRGLSVPEERDKHYFVSDGMRDFRFCHLEGGESGAS